MPQDLDRRAAQNAAEAEILRLEIERRDARWRQRLHLAISPVADDASPQERADALLQANLRLFVQNESLGETVQELRAELSAERDRLHAVAAERDRLHAALALKTRWPWGAHSTQLLEHLAAAAQRFWVNVDPRDHTTAPKNEDVEAWLRERGVAQRNAEVMATVLRDDSLPSGPRK